ncbi:MAG: DNA repair protein RecO, partial [Bdellovibrionaceae bacterium]|nr:DNA repair protein RecO [Pseudobdellovibrionaceae bacterium]
CVSRVGQEGDRASPELFNLLGHLLKNLASGGDIGILRLQFYLKFLYQQGVLQLEPWMSAFLQLPFSEHQTLVKLKEQALL